MLPGKVLDEMRRKSGRGSGGGATSSGGGNGGGALPAVQSSGAEPTVAKPTRDAKTKMKGASSAADDPLIAPKLSEQGVQPTKGTYPPSVAPVASSAAAATSTTTSSTAATDETKADVAKQTTSSTSVTAAEDATTASGNEASVQHEISLEDDDNSMLLRSEEEPKIQYFQVVAADKPGICGSVFSCWFGGGTD